mmetsp:Transcript_22534/g.50088  ORF Transcript_22534/g.50088 Transcript_22534/m.50088 type:complete len:327 (+) Transcript_22534:133-1113(+)
MSKLLTDSQLGCTPYKMNRMVSLLLMLCWRSAALPICCSARQRTSVGQLGAEQVFLESLYLLSGPIAHSNTAVQSRHRHIQQRDRRKALAHLTRAHAAATPCGLDDQRDGRTLVEQAQLGLRGGGRHVAQHALALDQDVVDVRHEAATVTQRVLAVYPEVHQSLVASVVLGGAQVAWCEYPPLGGNLEPGNADHPPLLVHRQLHTYGPPVCGGGGVQRQSGRDAGSVHHHQRGALLASCPVQQARPGPHAQNRAHCEVGIYNRRSIEGVERDAVAAAAARHCCGHLLGGGDLHQSACTQRIEQHRVRFEVHVQLVVPEIVRGSGNI